MAIDAKRRALPDVARLTARGLLTAALFLTAPPLDAQTAAQRPPPPLARSGGGDAEDVTVAGVDVVVRPQDYANQPGAVVGDIKPEIILGPADIQAYGVNTVTELLSELGPELRSDRGRGGEGPVVLVNGRRISGLNEIFSIPTEAIQRVDILPEEAALKFGYGADQRVVNIVLRRRFKAVTGEAEAGAPTAGGEAIGQAELDLLRIRRDNRLNLDLKYKAATGLTEADRGVPDPAGAPADRSLTPSTQSLTANAVVARPLPAGVNATVNATLGAMRSVSRQGLANDGGPGPGPGAAGTPLRQYAASWTGHLGSALNKDLSRWRLSLTDAYDHADTQTDTDMRTHRQAYARSISDSANIQLLANGPLIRLPAGDIYISAKLGDAESRLSAATDRSGAFRATSLSRNDANARLNLDLPLTSRRNRVAAVLGDLSVNANASVDHLSDYGTLTAYGFGLNWTPTPGYTLIVSHTRDEAAPTIQQLGGAVIATPGVQVFDFATGRTAIVTQITGGSANLAADRRDVLKIGLTAKPFAKQDLTFTANYIRSDIENPVATFPAASAAAQGAFPNRFLRDVDGELIAEDLRPVNFSRSERSQIRWGFNYARPLGKQPTREERRAFWMAAAAAMRAHGGGGDAPPPPAAADADARRSGGGPGGGGGRGGGFGGGGFPGSGRLQVAVYHTLYLVDRERIGPAGPTLDLLNGAAASGTGGQFRNEIEAQLGASLKGYGARLSVDWRSPTTVLGYPGAAGGALRFSDVTLINLRLFANLGQQFALVKRHPWLRGARVTLAVTNLLDERVQVRDEAGLTPLIYQPGYIDPTGRTVSLSLRKLFF